MKNKGITLIALIVTIIIMLILAGVSINALIGNNGIITKARDTAFSKEMPYIPKNNSRQPLLHDEMEIFVEGKRVCVWKSVFHDIAAVI